MRPPAPTPCNDLTRRPGWRRGHRKVRIARRGRKSTPPHRHNQCVMGRGTLSAPPWETPAPLSGPAQCVPPTRAKISGESPLGRPPRARPCLAHIVTRAAFEPRAPPRPRAAISRARRPDTRYCRARLRIRAAPRPRAAISRARRPDTRDSCARLRFRSAARR